MKDNHPRIEEGFFWYTEQKRPANPELLQPVPPMRRALVRQYLEHLQENFSGPHALLVDIKYFHLHNFAGFWHMPCEESIFFALCRLNQVRVLHLFRRNSTLAILSEILAKKRGIWDTRTAEPLPEVEFEVNVKEIELLVTALDLQRRAFSDFLLDAHLALHLSYEDLIEAGQLSTAVSEKLGDFLRCEQDWNPAPVLKKVSPPPEKYVTNYEELRDHIAKTCPPHLHI